MASPTVTSSAVSSCMYSEWMLDDGGDGEYRVTAPEDEDGTKGSDGTKDKNTRRGYKHVPHKDKPAQVVARRNARERRRVQAVNTAFARLRKAVPVENSRGKRISKVKTLQHAIDYIHSLADLLEQDRNYHVITHYYTHRFQDDFFADF